MIHSNRPGRWCRWAASATVLDMNVLTWLLVVTLAWLTAVSGAPADRGGPGDPGEVAAGGPGPTATARWAPPAAGAGGEAGVRSEAGVGGIPSAGWAWPITPTPPEVARPFDAPDHRFGPGHRGVDLVSRVAAPVRSPADGIVTFAGRVAGRPVVVVTHPGGLRTSLEPVAALARVGQPVARGAVVGVVTGEPGHCAPRTCVHWGVRRGEDYLDPLALIRGRIVLLPLRRALLVPALGQ